MKGKSRILIVLVTFYPLGLLAQGIDGIISSLEKIDCYRGDARFTVMMPQQPDDVVYDLELTSETDTKDRYSPCDYLIYWTLETPSGEVSGFSAYFDGHHYRYRSERLQEYHVEWDSIPFMPRGKVEGGVQQKAQFANLLPPYIAAELRRYQADSNYKIKTASRKVDGKDRDVVLVTMELDGTEVQKFEYVFDATTAYPVSFEGEYNIGALSEQTVSVRYLPAGSARSCGPWTEESLVALYPEPFEKYRENNFRVENTPGTRLPAFSLPTPSGARFSRAADDRFASPTVIALLDPATGYNAEVVEALRSAADQMPSEIGIIWAFTGNNAEQIEAIVPDVRPGERLLMSAGSLGRDLGATELPLLVLVGTDGKISDIILGYNQNLSSDVIQKMALAK